LTASWSGSRVTIGEKAMFNGRQLAAGGALVCVLAAIAAAQGEPSYAVGGPLAGIRGGSRVEGSREKWQAYFGHARTFFDGQSLVRKWTAPGIPGCADADVAQYAAVKPPVPVIRCSPGRPVLKLDLGELGPGLYVLRVIGAVDKKDIRPWHRPIFVALRVNDGLTGETSTHRVRASYNDEFYSVAEIYFDAPEKRAYGAELFVEAGSMADLLVQCVTLDDALAGCVRGAVKQRAALHDPNPAMAEARGTAATPERLARDAALWRALPPHNMRGAQCNLDGAAPPGTRGGAAGKDDKAIAEQSGAWTRVNCGIQGPVYAARFTRDPKLYNVYLVNKKLDLTYTVDDLWQGKPLPDPFPFKDAGGGLYTPDAADPAQGQMFAPIGIETQERLRAYWWLALNGLNIYRNSGDKEALRDAAVALVRFAHRFPSIDTSYCLYFGLREDGPAGKDNAQKQRMTTAYWMGHYEEYLGPIRVYDGLFEYIQGNEDLARSVSRFVPWVRSSADVVALVDSYLVQTLAKRILRYHYHDIPGAIATVAAVCGDPKVSDPWMEWLFTREYFYPLPLTGIQDISISGTDRYGCEYTGATFYAGEGAYSMAEDMQPYLRAGGDAKYSLHGYSRKPVDHALWHTLAIVGGAELARIADVSGPDKAPGRGFGTVAGVARDGWEWSGDPRFAWALKNLSGRRRESDAEWARIEAAAALVKRAPWLDLRSRAVDNWFGALEAGVEHDDYRFRRVAYLRTGIAQGHNHWDTLDLQFMMHGLPMTIDGGQRSGYSKPNDRFTRTHNTVEVDAGHSGSGILTYSWIANIADGEGARYMAAETLPPGTTRLYRRQVALLDVDAGGGSKPLSLAQLQLKSPLPAGPATPSSYLFDVFRVAGGTVHSYGFHGPVNDDFTSNLRNVRAVPHVRPVPGLPAGEAEMLGIFEQLPEMKFGGDAPDVLEATWRYKRTGVGSEQAMLGANFDAASPMKYTRLHLFDSAGLRALRAEVNCTHNPIHYHFTQLMVLRKGQDLETAFAAVIEPYAGEPLITGRRALTVAGNDSDAQRAVAVEVTTRNGHTDLCFADGRPEKTRVIEGTGLRVAAEFAYLSVDKEGVRQASISGGTLLQTPAVTLSVARRERTAAVIGADYARRALVTDAKWPAAARGRLIEIGTPQHRAAYHVVEIADDPKGSRLTLDSGADMVRTRVTRVAPGGVVNADLSGTIRKRGTSNWVASNESCTRFWRAAPQGGGFTLTGAPVAAEDFQPSGVLRLWEYGIGDTLRQSTFVNLRRVEGGWEAQGDVDVEITLAGKTRTITAEEFGKGGGKVRMQGL
jgi:hypothetical protein